MTESMGGVVLLIIVVSGCAIVLIGSGLGVAGWVFWQPTVIMASKWQKNMHFSRKKVGLGVIRESNYGISWRNLGQNTLCLILFMNDSRNFSLMGICFPPMKIWLSRIDSTSAILMI